MMIDTCFVIKRKWIIQRWRKLSISPKGRIITSKRIWRVVDVFYSWVSLYVPRSSCWSPKCRRRGMLWSVLTSLPGVYFFDFCQSNFEFRAISASSILIFCAFPSSFPTWPSTFCSRRTSRSRCGWPSAPYLHAALLSFFRPSIEFPLQSARWGHRRLSAWH